VTGRELIDEVQMLLADTGRGRRTSARAFDREDIADQLSICQVSACELLMQMPVPAPITLSKLVTTGAANGGVIGIAVPNNYWKLICGYVAATGKYIQMEEPKYGESVGTLIGNRIWAVGGRFFGTADTAVYYKRPDKIEDTGAALETFPDAFYATIKFAAARDMLSRQGREGYDRMLKFHKEFLTSLATLG